MFKIKNKDKKTLTHGIANRVIAEVAGDPPNITIEYFVGYLQGQTFISEGVDHILLTGTEYEEFAAQTLDEVETYLQGVLG